MLRTWSVLALVLVSALAVVNPNPVHVAVDETVNVTADATPYWFIYGASLSSEDPSVAFVAGRFPPRVSVAQVEVHGIRQGTTQIILTFVSGISIYRYPIAEVVVGPCVAPTIALSTRHERIRAGESVTLTAMTTGTGLVHVEWHEGDALLGISNPITLSSLPVGTHRITARAINKCGIAGEEVVVEVGRPRRRTVRQ